MKKQSLAALWLVVIAGAALFREGYQMRSFFSNEEANGHQLSLKTKVIPSNNLEIGCR